ncbi:hypothetical protein F2P81_017616 [Scophthalmus maximus]|uniref:Uncharacterized protein n=1 Tax=Scophthalmus maximus TaxID=52904 RepID=A0A6A4SEC7_SCOMX|nr:hypothetical protein F2P81_017616 [Scophthalmus maximus]
MEQQARNNEMNVQNYRRDDLRPLRPLTPDLMPRWSTGRHSCDAGARQEDELARQHEVNFVFRPLHMKPSLGRQQSESRLPSNANDIHTREQRRFVRPSTAHSNPLSGGRGPLGGFNGRHSSILRALNRLRRAEFAFQKQPRHRKLSHDDRDDEKHHVIRPR